MCLQVKIEISVARHHILVVICLDMYICKII